MRLSDELDKRGIKYTSEIINGSLCIKCANGVRVHIHKNLVQVCDKQGSVCLPPVANTLNYILEVIKENGN